MVNFIYPLLVRNTEDVYLISTDLSTINYERRMTANEFSAFCSKGLVVNMNKDFNNHPACFKLPLFPLKTNNVKFEKEVSVEEIKQSIIEFLKFESSEDLRIKSKGNLVANCLLLSITQGKSDILLDLNGNYQFLTDTVAKQIENWVAVIIGDKSILPENLKFKFLDVTPKDPWDVAQYNYSRLHFVRKHYVDESEIAATSYDLVTVSAFKAVFRYALKCADVQMSETQIENFSPDSVSGMIKVPKHGIILQPVVSQETLTNSFEGIMLRRPSIPTTPNIELTRKRKVMSESGTLNLGSILPATLVTESPVRNSIKSVNPPIITHEERQSMMESKTNKQDSEMLVESESKDEQDPELPDPFVEFPRKTKIIHPFPFEDYTENRSIPYVRNVPPFTPKTSINQSTQLFETYIDTEKLYYEAMKRGHVVTIQSREGRKILKDLGIELIIPSFNRYIQGNPSPNDQLEKLYKRCEGEIKFEHTKDVFKMLKLHEIKLSKVPNFVFGKLMSVAVIYALWNSGPSDTATLRKSVSTYLGDQISKNGINKAISSDPHLYQQNDTLWSLTQSGMNLAKILFKN